MDLNRYNNLFPLGIYGAVLVSTDLHHFALSLDVCNIDNKLFYGKPT